MFLTQADSIGAAARFTTGSTAGSQDPTVKRIAKVALGMIVAATDRLPGRRPLTDRAAGVVLLYHDIPVLERARFARQLDQLLEAGMPTACATFPSRPTGQWHIGVTFDDGLQTFVDVAQPELDRRNIPATMFAISGLLRDCDDELEPNHEGMPVMTRPGLATLPAAGHEVGSHGLRHRRLSLASDAEVFEELLTSRKQLEALVEQPITSLAFPFGDWTCQTVKIAVEAGYDRVYSVNPNLLGTGGDHPVVLGRIVVAPSDWRIETWLKLRGAYRWVAAWTHFKERLHGRR